MSQVRPVTYVSGLDGMQMAEGEDPASNLLRGLYTPYRVASQIA